METAGPLRLASVALVCALLCAPCRATPEPAAAPDAVMRLLEDRGLIEAAPAANQADQSLLNQVRNKASDLVVTAMNFIGVRYRRGGASASEGFDCSGFTRHIFENSIGLVLPRRADEQAKAPGLLNIGKDELRPGDLVFFNTLRRTFSHVGIYVGDGKFIHSPRTGGQVRVEDMREAYWTSSASTARAALPQVGDGSPAQHALKVDLTAVTASGRRASAAQSQPWATRVIALTDLRTIGVMFLRIPAHAEPSHGLADCWLDALGRPLRDLRISVTDRCNFRCGYCMPKQVFDSGVPLPAARLRLLSFEEITRLAGDLRAATAWASCA